MCAVSRSLAATSQSQGSAEHSNSSSALQSMRDQRIRGQRDSASLDQADAGKDKGDGPANNQPVVLSRFVTDFDTKSPIGAGGFGQVQPRHARAELDPT